MRVEKPGNFFCGQTLRELSGIETSGIAGIGDNDDVAKLLRVFLLLPWEDECTKSKWFNRMFDGRPGDLLWVLSLTRAWKGMENCRNGNLGD